MSVKERLMEFLSYEGIGQKRFAESIGMSSGYVNAIRKSIQPGTIHKIAMQYPNLNTCWLLNDFVVSVKENDCERVVSPIRGADFAMPVAGDSMAPEYPAGSQIFIKKINERAFIDWGKVYVLDTCNGSVIKRVFPSDDTEKVKCVSINPEYPPFEVSFEDIYGMYRVLLCMSVK